jgi:hypothetical protein
LCPFGSNSALQLHKLLSKVFLCSVCHCILVPCPRFHLKQNVSFQRWKNRCGSNRSCALALKRFISLRRKTLFANKLLLALQSPVVTTCTTRFNTQQFYVLPSQCTSVLCVDLRTNSDYFPIQPKLIGLYNREEVCSLHSTDWVFKYNYG